MLGSVRALKLCSCSKMLAVLPPRKHHKPQAFSFSMLRDLPYQMRPVAALAR
jgi:hypothetical protein